MATGASSPEPGRCAGLGRYQNPRHVATGGMGTVYRAFDPNFNREVALKVLLPEIAARPDRLERFRREAQHAARLRHENIVAIYETRPRPTAPISWRWSTSKGPTWTTTSRRNGPLNPEEARQLILAGGPRPGPRPRASASSTATSSRPTSC